MIYNFHYGKTYEKLDSSEFPNFIFVLLGDNWWILR